MAGLLDRGGAELRRGGARGAGETRVRGGCESGEMRCRRCGLGRLRRQGPVDPRRAGQIAPTPACVILGSAGKVLEGRGSGRLAGGSRREVWSTGQAWEPEFTAELVEQSCAGKEREVTAPTGGPCLSGARLTQARREALGYGERGASWAERWTVAG